MSDKKDERAVNPHTGKPIPDEGADGVAMPEPGQEAGTGTGGFAAAAGGAMTGALPPEKSTPPASKKAPEDVEKPTSDKGGSAPSQQEVAVRAALETVMDPEINLSVVDLGLIREILVQPDKTVIRMMMTTPFCPYAPQLVADVRQATMSVVPKECEVEVMPDPWSPDLMPDPSLLGYSF